MQAGQPCISVDTKKKELVGNFKNAGQIWCQEAEQVNIHDFPSEALGRAVTYGIYDLQHNTGTVYVGQSSDTPEFAVDNLAKWCQTELPLRFPGATRLFIEADGGGSNASRSRVFKADLLIDGTERRRQRPQKREKQRAHYSGKKKAHTDKNIVVVNRHSKKVAYLSPTRAGKVHDKKIADESAIRYPKLAVLGKDTGFQGYTPAQVLSYQPKKA